MELTGDLAQFGGGAGRTLDFGACLTVAADVIEQPDGPATLADGSAAGFALDLPECPET